MPTVPALPDPLPGCTWLTLAGQRPWPPLRLGTPARRGRLSRLLDGRPGAPVRVRPLPPGHRDHLVAVFDGLSDRSRYQRYHQAVPRLTPRMIDALVDVRPGRHEVVGAFRGGRPVGLARWIRDDRHPGRAELAAEVVDAAQGRGIGRALVVAAARTALASGVVEFECYLQPGSTRLHDWLHRLGGVPDEEDPTAWRVGTRRLLSPTGREI